MKLSKVGKTSQKCAWTAVATRASSKKFVNFRLTTKVHELYCGSAIKFMNFIVSLFAPIAGPGGGVKVHELYRKVHELYAKVHEP